MADPRSYSMPSPFNYSRQFSDIITPDEAAGVQYRFELSRLLDEYNKENINKAQLHSLVGSLADTAGVTSPAIKAQILGHQALNQAPQRPKIKPVTAQDEKEGLDYALQVGKELWQTISNFGDIADVRYGAAQQAAGTISDYNDEFVANQLRNPNADANDPQFLEDLISFVTPSGSAEAGAQRKAEAQASLAASGYTPPETVWGQAFENVTTLPGELLLGLFTGAVGAGAGGALGLASPVPFGSQAGFVWGGIMGSQAGMQTYAALQAAGETMDSWKNHPMWQEMKSQHIAAELPRIERELTTKIARRAYNNRMISSAALVDALSGIPVAKGAAIGTRIVANIGFDSATEAASELSDVVVQGYSVNQILKEHAQEQGFDAIANSDELATDYLSWLDKTENRNQAFHGAYVGAIAGGMTSAPISIAEAALDPQTRLQQKKEAEDRLEAEAEAGAKAVDRAIQNEKLAREQEKRQREAEAAKILQDIEAQKRRAERTHDLADLTKEVTKQFSPATWDGKGYKPPELPTFVRDNEKTYIYAGLTQKGVRLVDEVTKKKRVVKWADIDKMPKAKPEVPVAVDTNAQPIDSATTTTEGVAPPDISESKRAEIAAREVPRLQSAIEQFEAKLLDDPKEIPAAELEEYKRNTAKLENLQEYLAEYGWEFPEVSEDRELALDKAVETASKTASTKTKTTPAAPKYKVGDTIQYKSAKKNAKTGTWVVAGYDERGRALLYKQGQDASKTSPFGPEMLEAGIRRAAKDPAPPPAPKKEATTKTTPPPAPKKEATTATSEITPPKVGTILTNSKAKSPQQWKFVEVEQAEGKNKGKWKVQGLHKKEGDFNWFPASAFDGKPAKTETQKLQERRKKKEAEKTTPVVTEKKAEETTSGVEGTVFDYTTKDGVTSKYKIIKVRKGGKKPVVVQKEGEKTYREYTVAGIQAGVQRTEDKKAKATQKPVEAEKKTVDEVAEDLVKQVKAKKEKAAEVKESKSKETEVLEDNLKYEPGTKIRYASPRVKNAVPFELEVTGKNDKGMYLMKKEGEDPKPYKPATLEAGIQKAESIDKGETPAEPKATELPPAIKVGAVVPYEKADKKIVRYTVKEVEGNNVKVTNENGKELTFKNGKIVAPVERAIEKLLAAQAETSQEPKELKEPPKELKEPKEPQKAAPAPPKRNVAPIDSRNLTRELAQQVLKKGQPIMHKGRLFYFIDATDKRINWRMDGAKDDGKILWSTLNTYQKREQKKANIPTTPAPREAVQGSTIPTASPAPLAATTTTASPATTEPRERTGTMWRSEDPGITPAADEAIRTRWREDDELYQLAKDLEEADTPQKAKTYAKKLVSRSQRIAAARNREAQELLAKKSRKEMLASQISNADVARVMSAVLNQEFTEQDIQNIIGPTEVERPAFSATDISERDSELSARRREEAYEDSPDLSADAIRKRREAETGYAEVRASHLKVGGVAVNRKTGERKTVKAMTAMLDDNGILQPIVLFDDNDFTANEFGEWVDSEFDFVAPVEEATPTRRETFEQKELRLLELVNRVNDPLTKREEAQSLIEQRRDIDRAIRDLQREFTPEELAESEVYPILLRQQEELIQQAMSTSVPDTETIPASDVPIVSVLPELARLQEQYETSLETQAAAEEQAGAFIEATKKGDTVKYKGEDWILGEMKVNDKGVAKVKLESTTGGKPRVVNLETIEAARMEEAKKQASMLLSEDTAKDKEAKDKSNDPHEYDVLRHLVDWLTKSVFKGLNADDFVVYKDREEAVAAYRGKNDTVADMLESGTMEGSKIEGAVVPGADGPKVIFIANQFKLTKLKPLIRRGLGVFYHEAIGHYGLRKTFGSEKSYNDFAKRVYTDRRKEIDAWYNNRYRQPSGTTAIPNSENHHQDAAIRAHEWLAQNFTEDGIQELNLIDRVHLYLRDKLQGRDKQKITDAFVIRMYSDINKELRATKKRQKAASTVTKTAPKAAKSAKAAESEEKPKKTKEEEGIEASAKASLTNRQAEKEGIEASAKTSLTDRQKAIDESASIQLHSEYIMDYADAGEPRVAVDTGDARTPATLRKLFSLEPYKAYGFRLEELADGRMGFEIPDRFAVDYVAPFREVVTPESGLSEAYTVMSENYAPSTTNAKGVTGKHFDTYGDVVDFYNRTENLGGTQEYYTTDTPLERKDHELALHDINHRLATTGVTLAELSQLYEAEQVQLSAALNKYNADNNTDAARIVQKQLINNYLTQEFLANNELVSATSTELPQVNRELPRKEDFLLMSEVANPKALTSFRQDRWRNFLRWFAGSKIVDENGRPLVLYHGTAEESGRPIEELDTPRGTRRGMTYLSPYPDTSSGYAESQASSGYDPEYALEYGMVAEVFSDIVNQDTRKVTDPVEFAKRWDLLDRGLDFYVKAGYQVPTEIIDLGSVANDDYGNPAAPFEAQLELPQNWVTWYNFEGLVLTPELKARMDMFGSTPREREIWWEHSGPESELMSKAISLGREPWGVNPFTSIAEAYEVLWDAAESQYGRGAVVLPVYARALKVAGTRENPIGSWREVEDPKEFNSPAERWASEGYDAVWVGEVGTPGNWDKTETSLAVITLNNKSSNIKSVFNSGGYDQTDGRILFSETGQQLHNRMMNQLGASKAVAQAMLRGGIRGTVSEEGYTVFDDYDPEVQQQVLLSERAGEFGPTHMSQENGLRKLGAKIHQFFDPFAGLSPEMAQFYRQVKNRFAGVVGEIEDTYGTLASSFENLDTEEIQQVFDAFTATNATERQEIIDGLAPDVQANVIEAREKISQTGLSLVRAGLLSPESFDKYDGNYLPRKYLMYLLNEDDRIAFSSGKAVSNLDYLSRRKDIDQALRSFWGEVKDPMFLTARALIQPNRDLAMLEMFQLLAQVSRTPETRIDSMRNQELPLSGIRLDDDIQFDFVHRDSFITVNYADFIQQALDDRKLKAEDVLDGPILQQEDKQVSASFLRSEAERIKNLAVNSSGDKADLYSKVAVLMEDRANENLDFDYDPSLWVPVPDDVRYGAFRGMLLRKEVYQDILGDVELYKKMNDEWAVRQDKFIDFWKWGKVVANIPSWGRNIVSNLIMMHLGGMPLHRLDYLWKAASEIKNKGDRYNEFKREGLVKTTFSANELRQLDRKSLARIARAEREARGDEPRDILELMKSLAEPGSQLDRKYTWLREVTGDMYQGIEVWSKLAFAMYMQDQKGMSAADALIEANKPLFDYSEVSQGIRWVRRSAFGMPFVTWTYKATPFFADIIKSPSKWHRLAVPLALNYGLAQYITRGLEDEDEEQFKALMPDWVQKKGPFMFPWPTKDENGNVMMVDMQYLLPYASHAQAVEQLLSLEFSNAAKTMGAFSSPFWSMTVAAASGYDPFKQREIVDDPDSSETDKWLAYAKFYYDSVMPAMLASNGTAMNLFDAGLHELGYKESLVGDSLMYDSRGNIRNNIWQALSKTAGFNAYGFRLSDEQQKRMSTLNFRLRKAKQVMNREIERYSNIGNLDEEKIARIKEDYERKAKEIYEEMARLTGGSMTRIEENFE